MLYIILLDSSRITPLRNAILEGASGIFFCVTLNDATWYNDEGALISRSNPLYIRNADPLLQGYFECESKDENGKFFRARGKLLVIGTT